nr:hypothetical protein [Tanacetum cinerariifolium]
MADNRTMAELLQAPTEGYEDAIVIPEIVANNFELKNGLINLVQNKQFFGHDKEDLHAHIRYFNKITSTMRVPNFFPPLKTKNIRNVITRFQQRFDESFVEAWDCFNDLLRACPHHGFSELHQLDTFYNALNVNDQDSLNSAAGENFLDKMPRECLKIIDSKSKVPQSRAKAVVAKGDLPEIDPPEVPMADNRTMAELLQAPTEGYEDAIVIPEIVANNFELKNGLINLVQNKQFFGHDKEDLHAHIRYFNKITSTMRVPNVQSSSIKLMLFPFSLEGEALIWLEKEAPRSILTWDDLVTKFINQFFPPSKTINLRNEITRFQQRFDESFYEAWDCFNDLLRASTLPSNTITNPKEDLKGITTRSGAAYQGSPIPTQSKVVIQGTEVTKDQVQTPSSQSTTPVQPSVAQPKTQTLVSELVVAPVSVSIPYPSRRDNERHRDQANEQIEKFYEIFKEMSFEISFTDALILMPKFASTLKALIGNKEKLSEMARTPMNEHSLADLGASINLMPLSMWEGLSLPELTPTYMTLELTDRLVSKPIGIAKDVSVKVGVFHFPADFVVVDFE